MANHSDRKIPVIIITGFLGSGKTTILNHIVRQPDMRATAVIINEFGEIGIDHLLVETSEEQMIEINNGCICCTVRGDLIRILGNLIRRKERFDYVLLETTGLADPAPVAQTFFVDEEMREHLRLDGIVTLVDAKHVALHLDESRECQEQIAFADVVLLNKTDLVETAELDAVERRIRGMNAMARVHRTHNAAISMDHILGVGGFDLARAVEVKPTFLVAEHPFEWAGVFRVEPGAELVLGPGPDDSMIVVLESVGDEELFPIDARAGEIALRFSDTRRRADSGSGLAPGGPTYVLDTAGPAEKRFPIVVDSPATCAIYTQHHASEFALRVESPSGAASVLAERTYAPSHEHDASVGSVGIDEPGSLDPKRFNQWLGELLRNQGADIFRMKGILSMKGDDRRFVFQGVHMLFDGQPDRPWRAGERRSQLVFIGRNLDRERLTREFRACLA